MIKFITKYFFKSIVIIKNLFSFAIIEFIILAKILLKVNKYIKIIIIWRTITIIIIVFKILNINNKFLFSKLINSLNLEFKPENLKINSF